MIKKNKALTVDNVAVYDSQKNEFLVVQSVDNDSDGKMDELLFQTDLAGNQQKLFRVMTLPEGFTRPETQELSVWQVCS